MNENRKINNLKKLIVIISIAILVVAVILVMSIYNNKFGKVSDDGSRGGRSTAKTTETTDIIFDPETGDQILKISDKKNILVSGDSLEEGRSVKTDSNNNIVYKTNEKNSDYSKSTIVGKDKDNNVIKEETLSEQVTVSDTEENSVIIYSSYLETLSPAKYTITITYKDKDGKEKSYSFSYEIEEVWVEDPTSETTTTTIQVPTSGTTKVTYTKTRTIAPTSGTVVVTTSKPAKNYTVITAGSSGHYNAQPTIEWAMLNEINSKRTKPLKMAKELRSHAETQASNAVKSFNDSIANGCGAMNQAACKCNIDPAKFDNVAYCASERKDVSTAVSKLLSSNVGILDDVYEYIGIGVVYDEHGHYAWVVTVD